MPLHSKEKVFLLDETVLANLSPLQQKIMLELASGPLTLKLLSKRTGSSVYTIGKQLSLLQMRATYNPLQNKGINRPLVKKEKGLNIKTVYYVVPDVFQQP